MKTKEKILTLTAKDFRVEFYRASGNGGQNRNKRDTACRITHIASGVSAISADERSQLQNKKKAFERLTSKPEFKLWLNRKSLEALGEIKSSEQIQAEVEREIEEGLRTGAIIIECFKEEE